MSGGQPQTAARVWIGRHEAVVLGHMVDLLCQTCNDPSFGPALEMPQLADQPSDDERLALLELEFGQPDGPDPSADPPGGAALSGGQAVPPDPALRRLFPDACPTDPEVSRDLRRLTLAKQRLAKIMAAGQVRDDLAGVDADGWVLVTPASQAAWFSTLTAVRLMLAARLGIVFEADLDIAEEMDADDPNAWVYQIYEWLGWLLESMLDALAPIEG